jgi:hypothetical protein
VGALLRVTISSPAMCELACFILISHVRVMNKEQLLLQHMTTHHVTSHHITSHHIIGLRTRQQGARPRLTTSCQYTLLRVVESLPSGSKFFGANSDTICGFSNHFRMYRFTRIHRLTSVVSDQILFKRFPPPHLSFHLSIILFRTPTKTTKTMIREFSVFILRASATPLTVVHVVTNFSEGPNISRFRVDTLTISVLKLEAASCSGFLVTMYKATS